MSSILDKISEKIEDLHHELDELKKVREKTEVRIKEVEDQLYYMHHGRLPSEPPHGLS